MIVLRDAWYIVRVTGGPIDVLKGETRKKYSPEAGVGRSGGCLRERSPEESGILGKGKVKCGPCLHRGKAHEMCLVNKKKQVESQLAGERFRSEFTQNAEVLFWK